MKRDPSLSTHVFIWWSCYLYQIKYYCLNSSVVLLVCYNMSDSERCTFALSAAKDLGYKVLKCQNTVGHLQVHLKVCYILQTDWRKFRIQKKRNKI